MSRVIIMAALLLTAFTACETAPPASKPLAAPDMLNHDHIQTMELNESCAQACSPWLCSSAFGINAQALIPCSHKTESLCICMAPPND